MEILGNPAFTYFGVKYLLMALGAWFCIHVLATRQPKTIRIYNPEPFLRRHPFLMLGTYAGLAVLILFVFDNMRQADREHYYELLRAGAPIFYSWSMLGAIGITAISAAYLYWMKNVKLAGFVSFAAFILVALVAPYYYSAIG